MRRRRVILLLLLLLLPWGCSEQQPAPQDFLSSQNADLETTARSVLASVQLGRVESVYLLLDDATREKLTLESLEASFGEWWPQASTGGDLRARTVVSVDEGQAIATIGLQKGAHTPGREAADWIWHFVHQDSGWKVSRFEGGPPLYAQ